MKTTKILAMSILGFGLMVCPPTISWATPMGMAWTYQGRLMDANKSADGLYDVQFNLYDANVGGAQKGSTIDVNELDVIDGLFTVLLDFGSGVFDGNTVWLEIGVRAGELKDPNAYTTLSPRQEITPTPYALQTRGLFVDSALNVGIGTTNPVATLDVTNAGGYTAISGKSPWIGVYGIHNTTIGTFPGVWGDTDSLASVASGVRGRVTSTSPGLLSAGVWGMNASTGSNGIGVRGTHDGSGKGVYGSSLTGTGVYGIATGTSGVNYGVQGETDSSSGYAGYFTGGQNYFEGNVGIGTTNPRTELEIKGTKGLRVTTGEHSNVFGEFRHAYSGGLQINANAGGGWADISLQTDNTTRVFIESGGNVGIGTTTPSRKLTVRGNLLLESESTGAAVAELGEGLDYAEGFNVTDKNAVKPGTVLVIDPECPGKLTVSDKAYDSRVAGIAAGSKGLGSGVRLGVGQFDCDVALAGRVYCNVDARENGVEPGDLLTTSATPGYAMKAVEYTRAQGATLGKAMERLGKGQKGQILVLVTLQ
ncbi:MAG: hypothetical protein NTX52_07805 [Planctomycetota bacterium]|nr:hypothetical protein [Planctomycetota bacterium]